MALSRDHDGGGVSVQLRENDDDSSFVLWGDRLRYVTRDRVLLDTSSVSLKSGELSVILGPSGVGKTTLLNALTGRVKPTFGQVGINEELMSDPISKYLINYVMATDRMNEYLTVEETLLHTAQLKLPHISQEECRAAALKVMQQLNILHCAKTLVGGTWRKGISKGETKRLAVACELLGSPSCLILDEPTSGLDSSISFELVKILKLVARENNMVVLCTLHQPNQRIFDLIDTLIVMGGAPGRILYQGSPKNALPFFKARGLYPPTSQDGDQMQTSVPDLIMDLIVGGSGVNEWSQSPEVTAGGELSQLDSEDIFCRCPLRSDKSSIITNSRKPSPSPSSPSGPSPLGGSPVGSRKPCALDSLSPSVSPHPGRSMVRRTHDELVNQIVPQQPIIENDFGPLRNMSYIKAITDAQSWGSQFHVCLRNSFKSNRRNPITVLIILLINIVQSILLGFIMFQVDSDMVDVDSGNYLDWPIFQSAPLRFLAYGLTNSEDTVHRIDPIDNLIKIGANNSTLKSMPLEIAGNPEMVEWLADMVKCVRTNYFLQDGSGSGKSAIPQYPRWDFTNLNSHQSRSSPDYSAPGDVCWNDVNTHNETNLGNWQMNQALTFITAATQMADLTLGYSTIKTVPGRDGGIFDWLSFSMSINKLTDAFLCCGGAPYGIMTLNGCDSSYKNYKLPIFPGRMYWPEYNEQTLRDFTEFLQKDVFIHLAEMGEEQQQQQLMNGGAGGEGEDGEIGGATLKSLQKSLFNISDILQRIIRSGTQPLRLRSRRGASSADTQSLSSGGTLSPSTVKLGEDIFAYLANHSSAADAAGAPRRRLGSGLAGMVTDLISLLTKNTHSPVYKVIMSLGTLYEKIESSECSTRYCHMIVESVTTIRRMSNDVSTGLLTILNICSVIFFLVANLGFSSYDILLQFPQIRAIFNRERANGMYRTSSFLLAKMVADLPFHIIPGLVWALIYWYMTGLDTDPLKVAQYCGLAALISFTSYSLGYFISSLVLHLETSVILSPMILLCMLVLAGFFLRDAEMPDWIAWARYASIYRWAYFAVMLVQFPPGGSYGPIPNSLALVLAGVTDQNMWRVCICLVAIAIGCRIACYVCLRCLYTSQGKQA